MRALKIIFSLGIVWALLGQALGAAAGLFVVRIIRAAAGLDPSPEAEIVLAAIFSVFGSLLGSGTLTDWLKWTVGKQTILRHGNPEGLPAWTRYFSVDYNHKVIGIQYGVTSIVVLLVGGILAIIFRLELSWPGGQFLTPENYNTIFSAHGIIMIASILLGVGAMINYLAPMMIGASDMAFPRLNAFSYWISIPSAILIMSGIVVGGGWETGWVGYPPLSTIEGSPLGTQLFVLGFYFNGLSSIAGAINLLVTVATMRAKGMSLFRMPIFVWAAVATSLIQFTATQTVGAALLMITLQRVFGLGFFDATFTNALGWPAGDPILYQHLFWLDRKSVV